MARVALSSVTIPRGLPLSGAFATSAANLLAAIARANAATACPPLSRALHGTAESARSLLSATDPWASFAVNIGASGTAADLASIAAAVSSATAAAFPRTTTAWAQTWGYNTAVQWTDNFGSPVALVAGSVVTTNDASFSPAPVAAQGQGLTTSQQLGLGLGIALPLAVIIVFITLCAYKSVLCGKKAALPDAKSAAV